MTRTLLYYPTITVKSPGWIRQAILYWDNIGSIVPHEFERIPHQQIDLTVLADHGLYRMFHPEEYINQNEDLADEFIAFLKSHKTRYIRQHPSPHDRFEIYKYKMHPKLIEYLSTNEIALPVADDYLSFPRFEGLCYMAFLAKYLADEDYQSATTPSTDYLLYRRLVFAPNIPTSKRNFPGLLFALQNILPIPLDDVPIEKILEFKQQREIELLQFREIIDRFESTMKQAQETGEIQHILQVFSENIKVNIELIDRLCADGKIATRLGTLENIFKIENIEVLLDLAEVVSNPISVTTARKLVSGSLSVAKYMLDRRNEQRKTLSLGSYSYLYHAQKEGIINRP